jgi:hypothetical protein
VGSGGGGGGEGWGAGVCEERRPRECRTRVAAQVLAEYVACSFTERYIIVRGSSHVLEVEAFMAAEHIRWELCWSFILFTKRRYDVKVSGGSAACMCVCLGRLGVWGGQLLSGAVYRRGWACGKGTDGRSQSTS